MPNDDLYWFLRHALRSGALSLKLKFNAEVLSLCKKVPLTVKLLSDFLLYDVVGEFPFGGLWGVCVETVLNYNI